MLFAFLALLALNSLGQTKIEITILPRGIEAAEVFIDNTDLVFKADKSGKVSIGPLAPGEHVLTVFAAGYASKTLVLPAGTTSLTVELVPLEVDLNMVNIIELNRSAQGMTRLRNIEVDGLYAAKKNEIVLPDEMSLNRSTNNSRQLFAKVAGINVQETDAGGLQMGIGARGLDPKRTTHFNTRQDGYDISADALGYPESYYTPPIEAVERIELVRGAASLQFGTQFGGLLNFKMKRGNPYKPLEITQRLTAGSYGYTGSFTSLGGTKNGWNYYGYFLHKQGNGWRPNSNFNSNGAYFHVGKKINDNWEIEFAHTHSYYNSQQAGGLTDRQFEIDPSVSFRERNWFQVNWNVSAVTLNGRIANNLTLNSKTFWINSSRAALGFLGNINRTDTNGLRDLILGEFNNIGNETRLVKRFNINQNPGAIILGSRIYQGNTRNRQGKADNGYGPNYSFISEASKTGSDVLFPSQNISLFSEAIIPLSSCINLTPGIRFEHIQTASEGTNTETNRHPLTNEILSRVTYQESSNRIRNLVLLGFGASWRCKPNVEIYTNVSENYRAMNFSDIYVNNPNLLIAKDMQDETGFTADLGMKGSAWQSAFHWDAGVFMMQYNNRIGERLTVDVNDAGIRRIVNLRDNIANAQFFGVEIFEELDIISVLDSKSKWRLVWYNNIALVEARYRQVEVSAFDGNRVENVPRINFKTGMSMGKNRFACGVQFNHVSDQFTDATNAEYFPDATVGVIPAYQVVDLSASYAWKWLRIEGSINNLADQIYFTRRATGYPGPGIIPAERRMFFMTIGVQL